MRFVFIYIFFLSVCVASAQSYVVADILTRMPVAGAKVYQNPTATTETNRYGRFSLKEGCNGLTIVHRNYESRVMRKSELRDTVLLIPKLHTLDEVVITAMRPRVGFDVKKAIKRSVEFAPKQGSGSGGFDFFSVFDRSQKRKSRKEHERFKRILKNY